MYRSSIIKFTSHQCNERVVYYSCLLASSRQAYQVPMLPACNAVPIHAIIKRDLFLGDLLVDLGLVVVGGLVNLVGKGILGGRGTE